MRDAAIILATVALVAFVASKYGAVAGFALFLFLLVIVILFDFGADAATNISNQQSQPCRAPTPNNPFMNPSAADYVPTPLDPDVYVYPPDQIAPCNVDDDELQNDNAVIHDPTYYSKLFLDTSDLYEKETSERQYYTVPKMNPPDTLAFARWLYDSNSICKVDQSKCLKYEDIRSNRDNDLFPLSVPA